jgi:hypothetical protein
MEPHTISPNYKIRGLIDVNYIDTSTYTEYRRSRHLCSKGGFPDFHIKEGREFVSTQNGSNNKTENKNQKTLCWLYSPHNGHLRMFERGRLKIYDTEPNDLDNMLHSLTKRSLHYQCTIQDFHL